MILHYVFIYGFRWILKCDEIITYICHYFISEYCYYSSKIQWIMQLCNAKFLNGKLYEDNIDDNDVYFFEPLKLYYK